ncbi:hypothetical protein Bca52824_032668 [Brassica carinata]|uniref:Uncharacterized protein n=1 Tax=Brassica carinata TaxID=52824 RepID=A0A8X7SDJ1_BRACI|nr:hypothetical protein Bca52824_032668 [Brassica carinata]
MNDADVSKQIQQMVRFIRQEAEEKANEISISAEEDDYSTQLNASRIKYLQAQDDVVTSMKDSAAKDLLRVSSDKNAYKKLLKALVVESLLRLKEQSVLLRCREMDKKVVESIIEDAKKQYADKANVPSPKITIDEKCSSLHLLTLSSLTPMTLTGKHLPISLSCLFTEYSSTMVF